MDSYIPRIVQYADDTTILINYSNIQQLHLSLIEIGNNLSIYLRSLDLKLNTSKTEFLLFGEKCEKELIFLNQTFLSKSTTKFLGLHLSNSRSFNDHINLHMIPKIRKNFSIFRSLSRIINLHTKHMVFQAFIMPHILYGLPFITMSNHCDLLNLRRSYNQAIKILFNLPFRFSSDDLVHKTGINSLSYAINTHILKFAYLIYNEKLPSVLNSFFIRSASGNFILKPHRDSKSLHNHIAQIWNTLPKQTKKENLKSQFELFIRQSPNFCSH